MTTTLVVGATGLVGSQVVDTLLSRGERVRILARPGADIAALIHGGAEPVPGDMADHDSLAQAVADVDAVVATANSARPRLDHDTVDVIERSGYPALITAAAREGVGRFIYLSALIATKDSPVPFLRSKYDVERYLTGSGMPYTIIAPGPFDEVWTAAVVGGPIAAGAPVTLVRPGTHRHSFVSAADVAAYCAAALGRAEAVNKRLVVGGPANLTWLDVVAVYEEVLDRAIQVRFINPGEPLPGVPPGFSDLLAGFEAGHADIDMSALPELYGIEPTPLRTVVERMLRPAS